MEGNRLDSRIGLVIGESLERSIFLACLLYFFSIAVCSASNDKQFQ